MNHNHGVHLRLAGGLPERLLCRLESNSLTSNGGCGLVAGISSLPGRLEVIGNGVYDNAEHGVLLHVDSTASHNDIVGNASSAVRTQGKLHLRLQNCRVHCAAAPPLQLRSEDVRNELRNNAFLYASSAPGDTDPVKASAATRAGEFVVELAHGAPAGYSATVIGSCVAALTMDGNKVIRVAASPGGNSTCTAVPVSQTLPHWHPTDPAPRPALPSNVRPPPPPHRSAAAEMAERHFRTGTSPNIFYCGGTNNERFGSLFCTLL